MFISITYFKKPATDLGYLLHKNPNRPQTFDLNFGKAHVFYPEINEEQTTIALFLEVNPIELVRGKRGELGLFDYVNDRPYVSSSFLSVAMAKVFGTAMSGKSKEKPELAEEELPFEVKIAMVPCESNEKLIHRLFTPLGYHVEIECYLLDDIFTHWGESHYYTITLRGNVKIQDLLNHLYVLIPVLDQDKHYYIDDEEIEKLIRHGGVWLKNHPEIELITSRYLYKRRNLIKRALNKLIEVDEIEDTFKEKIPRLNDQRIESVFSIIKLKAPKTIIDLGCGEGDLLYYIAKNAKFDKLTGVDVSFSELEKTKLKLERLPEILNKKISLFQGSLTYKDNRFNGYDLATIIEVIEHLDENRLKTFENVVFKYAKPKIVIITTPNVEYNQCYSTLNETELRHHDHRFEWTRAHFRKWAEKIGLNYNYKVEFHEIGDRHETFGSPTQMGVFELC